MSTARRDENGVWTVIAGDGDTPIFSEQATVHLNSLDPIFERARAASEFEFILCLLRFRGMEDGGWDPYDTTLRAIPKIRDLGAEADFETHTHLALWIYGHVLEASAPYEVLADLVGIASGGRHTIGTAFPPRGNRQPTPGEKIQTLQVMATKAGFAGAFDQLRAVWDRRLRNAVFHADYSVTRSGLRTLDPYHEYNWNAFKVLVNGAFAYHMAFAELYKMHVSSYNEPVQIPVHPDFSADPDERATVMVRENYGVIGVKDSWTIEEIHDGRIPFRIGRFFREEVDLANADPTRALFPAVKA